MTTLRAEVDVKKKAIAQSLVNLPQRERLFTHPLNDIQNMVTLIEMEECLCQVGSRKRKEGEDNEEGCHPVGSWKGSRSRKTWKRWRQVDAVELVKWFLQDAAMKFQFWWNGEKNQASSTSTGACAQLAHNAHSRFWPNVLRLFVGSLLFLWVSTTWFLKSSTVVWGSTTFGRTKNEDKHCQRHNGPEGWVLLTKVTS